MGIGIFEYIENKRAKESTHKQSRIDLTKPVLNVFLGDFDDEAKGYLINTLNNRIGSKGSVLFCNIDFSGCEAALPEQTTDGVYRFPIRAVTNFDSLAVEKWDEIKNAVRAEDLRDDVLDLVNYVFNTASVQAFSYKGWIQVNYILKADFAGNSVLDAVREQFSRSLTENFSNGVQTDYYCLLDQKGYTQAEKGENRKILNYLTINLLDEIMSKSQFSQTYMLSNYISHSYLDVENLESRMQTIALDIIVKNGKSAESGSLGASYCYDNNNFRDYTINYDKPAARFCTLGKLNLMVDDEIRRSVVYKNVMENICSSLVNRQAIGMLLADMGISEEQLHARASSLTRDVLVSPYAFHPMVKRGAVQASALLGKPRGYVLENVYGRNLEFFWNVNYLISDGLTHEIVNEMLIRVRSALEMAQQKDGYTLAELAEAAIAARDMVASLAQKYRKLTGDSAVGFKTWLNEPFLVNNVNEKNKDTGELEVFYIMACEYIDQRRNTLQYENVGRLAAFLLDGMNSIVEKYEKQVATIHSAVKDLAAYVYDNEQDGEPLLLGNMNGYYSWLVQKYMRESIEYQNFRAEISYQICENELIGNAIFERVIEFCDSTIINQTFGFESDIAREMQRRLLNYANYNTPDSIYQLAYSTIMDKIYYYIQCEQFGGVNNVVCFFVNPNNEFVRSTNEQLREKLSSRQMNIFYEDYFDGMDILFMAGRFEAAGIYMYSNYKRIYEQWMADRTEKSELTDAPSELEV